MPYTRRKALHNPELLRKLYFSQNKLQREIAEELGCSLAAVSLAMKRHGLRKKSWEIRKTPKKTSNPYLYDRDWLYDQHVTQRKMQTEIAQQLGVSREAVQRAFRRFGIQSRTYHPQWRPELRKFTPDQDEEIAKAYLSGLTLQDLAGQLHVGIKAIRNALIRKDIKFRHLGTKGLEIRMPQDPKEIGYLAGLLDGEGWITWHKKSERKVGKYPMIGVANTNSEVLKYLESIGGKVSWRPERAGVFMGMTKKLSACGSWELHGTLNIIVFLKAVLPTLIIKKKETEAMLFELEKRVKGRFVDAE
jgi:biotin operon repressor